MANEFDQFDAPSGGSKANTFDQFDDKSAGNKSEGSKPEEKQDDSFAGGVKRGFMERGLGVDQLLNQIGVGGMVPVYTHGKLSFGLPPNEELAEQEKALEKQGEGTGIKGAAAEFIGDPVSYVPGPQKILKGLNAVGKFMTQGGLQAALSGVTAPTTKGDQTLSERGEGAALSGAAGAATGGVLGKVGSKFPGRSVSGKMSDPGELYKAAQKMGLKFTGKETPEQINDMIQNAVKSRVDALAEKSNPGSSTSRMWEVGTNLATSKMYGQAVAKNNALYKVAEQLGAKESVPVEGIAADIDSLIKHMEKQAPYQAANPKFGTALNTLHEIHENILNGGQAATEETPWARIQRLVSGGENHENVNINGNQLIELDQALNENLGRTGGKGASGRALEQLQNKVQTAISQMSPAFSKAYQAAKNDFRQNVIQNFRENPTLKKYWNEDDFRAYEALARGIKLHPELKARVDGMLEKLTSYNDLAELQKNLDPATYDSVRAAKFVQLMNKAGLDSEKLGDEKTYAMLEKTLANKPEDLQALDAIKTFSEQMTKRGLAGKVDPADLQESNKLMNRAMRTAFSFATGHKLYGLQHAMEMIRGKTPTGVKGKLTGIAEEAAKGAPQPQYEPGTIPKILNRVGATEEGRNAQ